MRVNLTHNDNIKTFDDVARHVELKKDCLLAEKPVQEAFMTKLQNHTMRQHLTVMSNMINECEGKAWC